MDLFLAFGPPSNVGSERHGSFEPSFIFGERSSAPEQPHAGTSALAAFPFASFDTQPSGCMSLENAGKGPDELALQDPGGIVEDILGEAPFSGIVISSASPARKGESLPFRPTPAGGPNM